MEIVLIRHAQPEWVRDDCAVLDPDLTAVGVRQTASLAHAPALRGRTPTALLVSPTRRSRATAAPLATALGVAPRVAPWLEEMRLPPAWNGAPAHTLAEFFSTARSRSFDDWLAGSPGGERFDAFRERVTGGLAATLEEFGARVVPDAGHPGVFRIEAQGVRIVIVAHGGTNAVALTWLLGVDQVPWAWERFVARHASITRVRAVPLMGGHVFGLREHSDVAHLAHDERTR
jgi:probable phosphoglycerate mutase